jgi:hypothetical protein
MADERKSGYCKNCQKDVVVFRPGTNHILHLLLSVLTMGIWIIPWLLDCIKIGGWRCQVCGSKSVRRIK